MNLDSIFGMVQGTGLDAQLENLQNAGEISYFVLIGGVAVSIILGLLWCFLGLKTVRVWSAVFGFVIGIIIGAGAALAFDQSQTIVLIAGFAVGILMAVLSAGIYHVGVFLVAWIIGTSAVYSILPSHQLIYLVVSAAVGLVLALITLKFAEPIIIVITSLYGALLVSAAVFLLFPFDESAIRIAVTAVLAVLGIAIQSLLESGKRKRQNLKRAEEIRQSNSTANEVERAREMMENLDKMPMPGEEEDESEVLDLEDDI